MSAPGCLAALLTALFCATGSIIATALAWTGLAIFLGAAVIFFVVLALTYVIPAAAKETRP